MVGIEIECSCHLPQRHEQHNPAQPFLDTETSEHDRKGVEDFRKRHRQAANKDACRQAEQDDQPKPQLHLDMEQRKNISAYAAQNYRIQVGGQAVLGRQ